MAAKKQTKNSTSSKTSKKPWRKHKLLIALLVPVLLVLGIFGYNKYLDRQNVEDMKELLASFEQLERDVEAETGEELVIEADCGSVGKFATSYVCTLHLIRSDREPVSAVYTEAVNRKMSDDLTTKHGCGLLSSLGYTGGELGDLFRCQIAARPSREKNAREIFRQYDTSLSPLF